MYIKKYNSEYQKRQSIRLKNFDYSQKGMYFITICGASRDPIFGEVQSKRMHLSVIGQIVKECWNKTFEIRNYCYSEIYCIMPNHFHAIISIEVPPKVSSKSGFVSPSHTLGSIVRGFKGCATREVRKWLIEKYNTNSKLLYPISNIGLKDSIWQRGY
ncbi:MAG: hypothetical protein OIF50_15080 [Flavobacteriaceae bacterium]|nr:hypothetical protein [Flavobacteriaceae bacterium]